MFHPLQFISVYVTVSTLELNTAISVLYTLPGLNVRSIDLVVFNTQMSFSEKIPHLSYFHTSGLESRGCLGTSQEQRECHSKASRGRVRLHYIKINGTVEILMKRIRPWSSS